MNPLETVTIVGAGAAGVSLASSLRRRGYQGGITLIGEETVEPYDRPPLSKGFLMAKQSVDDLRLFGWSELDALGVDVRAGEVAQSLDTATRTVTLDSSEEVTADAVVIATGVKARTLPQYEHLGACVSLRTIEDARRLRERLQKASRVVIVGAGFIGLEAVGAALSLGCDVTIVEPQPAALAGKLPLAVSEWLSEEHRARGVRFHFGAGVDDISRDGDDRYRVLLTTGETVDADVVLVGIGTVPNTDWLETSDLVLQNGVQCDEFSRATDGIYAIGDVSSPLHPALGRHLRVEHRSNANEQAMALADTLTGEPKAHSPLPFFWTDQFEYKLQMFGVAAPDAQFRIVSGAIGDRSFIGVYERGDRVEAVLACNALAKEIMTYRRELNQLYSVPTSLAAAVAS